ncbi:hypothetical protein FFK22_009325 [Mycobacterium sp. KBS0706]|uniref:hypothetical protein n=1 Tax=Mycobacterium sp. KBS0706 TaxID=2578109 RepID=UPI00110FD09B|nr:hypothetical protein [Mycobacterium sp. KBS0706]TSD88914.1 hypothetical protein FFK22_009325 [Mycobacterium sp. KBS0706]
MPISLRNRGEFHRWQGSRPTSAPVHSTAEVTRTTTLPGAITITVKALAEILSDGTIGAGTAVAWELSDRPALGPETEDGRFYDAFAEAVEGAWGEAMQDALSRGPAAPRTGDLPPPPPA